MRSTLIFLSIVVLTSGEPKVRTWPLNELYDALENLPKDSPMRKYANEAVTFIFDHIRRDHKKEFGHVILPSPSGAEVWMKNELQQAVDEIDISPVIGFYARPALERLNEENTAQLLVPAVDISTWSASDVSDALKDPATKPAMLPYLKKAEKKFNGVENQKEVTLVTPIGLVPLKSGPHYPTGYVTQAIYITR